MNNYQQQDFKKKREQFFINVRKNEREQRFNKRRNIDTNIEHDQYDGTKINEQKPALIIDQTNRQQIKQIMSKKIDESMFDKLSEYALSSDIMLIHEGVIGMRKLLAKNVDPPIKRFVDKGLIMKFIQYAKQKQFPQIKLQSVWALTNIAAGQSQYCAIIVQRGCIQLFISLLHENEKGIVDQAIWGIGNIAADNVKYRDRILKLGGLQALIKIIQNSQNKLIIRNGTWAATNLCRGFPIPNYNLIKQACPLLCKVLKSGALGQNKQLISDIIWALSYFTQGCKTRVQIVNKANILDIIFKYAIDTYKGIYVPAIKVIGNFSNGNQIHTQALIKNGIFDLALIILQHPKKSMRRQMCWILSNCAAGIASQVAVFLSRIDLLDKIGILFHQDLNQIKRQICWIYANFGHLGDRNKVIQILLHYQVMRIYVNLLNQDIPDILENALETLYKIFMVGKKYYGNNQNLLIVKFQEYGGCPRLQALQMHQNGKVYQAAVKLLKKFFDLQTQKQFI